METRMNKLTKSTIDFKRSLDIFIVIVVALPIIHLSLFNFNIASYSVTFSLVFGVWLFKNRTLNSQTLIKFNVFVWGVYSIPFVTLGIIVSSFYYAPVRSILEMFPIYLMLPMMLYFYMISKYLYKLIDSKCIKKAILRELNMSENDYTMVLNFSDDYFVEFFKDFDIDIGSGYINDSKIRVEDIMNNTLIRKVCNLTEKQPHELTKNDFTLNNMIEI